MRLTTHLSRQYTFKARPVTFNRVNYRSVLEGRWAVFLFELKIDYIYEPRTYRLRTGWHIPDFWLPKYNTWIQVKGPQPTKHDILELAELVRVTRASAGQVWQKLPPPNTWRHEWQFIAVGPSIVQITESFSYNTVKRAFAIAKTVKL